MPLHIETPYVESRALSERSGRSIWLKFESAQPSGSFKLRGIGHACETYFARGVPSALFRPPAAMQALPWRTPDGSWVSR